MPPLPTFPAALIALAALAGCGTKTPLALPPPAQPAIAVPQTPVATTDSTNKAAAEPRR